MPVNITRNTELIIEGVEGFGFQRVEYLTRQVIANMLLLFFNSEAPSLCAVLNDLDQYSPTSNSPLYILQEFSSIEEKFPAILVGIGDSNETNTHLGADNLVGVSKMGGTDYRGWYNGGWDIQVNVGVMGESPDFTLNVASLIAKAFTHYFRGHYFFIGDDNSSFSIVPSQSKIKIGSEFEVQKGDKSYIYGRIVPFTSSTQYVYTDEMVTSRYRLLQNIEIDPNSGPIST